jgi:hypothetical protein
LTTTIGDPDVEIAIAKRDHVGKRLAFWFMFGVIFAVLPVSLRILVSGMSKNGVSIEQLLGDGELFISTAAISAAAIGDILYVAFQEGNKFSTSKQIVSGFSAFVCLGCCLLSAAAYLNVKASTAGAIVDVSVALFVITLVAAMACVSLAATR